MSAVAQRLGVNKSTVSRFVARHESLRLLILEIVDDVNDLAEASLITAIKAGEPWAIKYWLDNKGQDRGFGIRKLAFKDQQGRITVPAVFVTDGEMSEEEWAATDWAAESAAAAPPPPDATIN